VRKRLTLASRAVALPSLWQFRLHSRLGLITHHSVYLYLSSRTSVARKRADQWTAPTARNRRREGSALLPRWQPSLGKTTMSFRTRSAAAFEERRVNNPSVQPVEVLGSMGAALFPGVGKGAVLCSIFVDEGPASNCIPCHFRPGTSLTLFPANHSQRISVP